MSRLIYRTDRPDMIGARVLPMTEYDRLWPHTRAIARKQAMRQKEN